MGSLRLRVFRTVLVAVVSMCLAFVASPAWGLPSVKSVGSSSSRAAAVTPTTQVTFGGGDLQPLVPSRVLDTRSGIGAAKARVTAGQSISLKVTGVGGVPVTGVGAVVLNVTGVGASRATYLTVWPHGAVRPTASSLNLAAGMTAPNLVISKVGTDGRIDIYNSSGTVDLLADVSGWFPEGVGVESVVPTRLLDTRTGVGAPKAKIGPRATITVQLTGRAPVPATDVAAVVVNITAVNPTAGTYVTSWPAGDPMPTASTVNAPAGATVPNLAVVPVSTGGAVSLYNSAGNTDLLIDVVGYLPTTSAYVPLQPTRIMDTRNGLGVPKAKIDAGAVKSLTIGDPVPSGAGAVVLNVTGILPTASTYVTAWPHGGPRPTASNLNLAARVTRANLVVVKVGTQSLVDFYNQAGTLDLAVDVVGYFPSAGTDKTGFTPTPGTELEGSGDVTAYRPASTTALGSVTFSASADVPAVGRSFALMKGGPGGSGASGKIVGLTRNSNGTTTATISAVKLQDLFTDLEIHSTTASAAPGAARRTAARQQAAKAPSAQSGCQLAGGGSITPSIAYPMGLGSADFSLRNQTARVVLNGRVDVSFSASFTGSAACTVTIGEVPLGWIGPAEASAGVKLSATVSGTVTSASATTSFPYRIGFSYDHGTTTNLSTLEQQGSGDGDASVGGSVAAGLQLAVAFKLFGVIGVEAAAGPSLTLDVSPPSCVELDLTFDLGLSAVAERWGVGWSFTLATITIGPATLYRSTGCGGKKWVGNVTVNASSSIISLNPAYTGNDYFHDRLQGTFTLQGAGSGDGSTGDGTYATTFTGSAHSDTGGDHCSGTWREDIDAGFTAARRTNGVVLIQTETGWTAAIDGLSPIPYSGETGLASGGIVDTSSCDSTHTTTWGTVQAEGWGYSFRAWPTQYYPPEQLFGNLNDTDPDRAHLVGASTFSGTSSDGTSNYNWSITFTYDLRLVNVS